MSTIFLVQPQELKRGTGKFLSPNTCLIKRGTKKGAHWKYRFLDAAPNLHNQNLQILGIYTFNNDPDEFTQIWETFVQSISLIT